MVSNSKWYPRERLLHFKTIQNLKIKYFVSNMTTRPRLFLTNKVILIRLFLLRIVEKTLLLTLVNLLVEYLHQYCARALYFSTPRRVY